MRGGEGSNVDICMVPYCAYGTESRHMHNMYLVYRYGTVPSIAPQLAKVQYFQYRMHTTSIGTGTNGTENQ